MSAFRYWPLRTQSNIRLLEILPGHWNSPVVAYFTEIDLAANPVHPYECLSYTWDPLGMEEVMFIDNSEFRVRPNLHNFIKRLRSERAPRALWADAICINQNDDVEKGFQVQRMGDIYRRAFCVLAWVGEHGNGSEQLFRGWPIQEHSSVRRLFSKRLSSKEQAYRKSIWTAFLSRKYWTRSWIIQEIALAQYIYVYCGNDSMSWEDLIESRTLVPASNRHASLIGRGYQVSPLAFPGYDIDGIEFGHDYSDQLHIVRTIRLQGQRKTTLESLIHEFGVMTDCGDPKDKIFAFLAMENDVEAPKMISDYTSSKAEVFLRFWLRRFVSPGMLHGGVERPGLFMLLLKFDFTDDCQLADYVLDKLEGECLNAFLDVSSPKRPWKAWYHTYLDAVQALWDSGLQPQSEGPRLGHFLPPKPPWHQPTTKTATGRSYLTEEEREEDDAIRFQMHRRMLGEHRHRLVMEGQWRPTRPMTMHPPWSSVGRGNGLPAILNNEDDPQEIAHWRCFSQGTQPVPILDTKSRLIVPGRRWYQRSQVGVLTRPTVVKTYALQAELTRAREQHGRLAYQDRDPMPATPWKLGG
jgi:hypothetical protein